MKRFVLIIFSLCLAVALSLSASAESNKLTYAVGASAPTVSANTEFQIFVEIPENTGICYLKATVTYDSSLLTYVSASTSTSDFVGAPIEANYKVSAPGKVNVILGTMNTLFAENPTIYTNTGELIALTFRVNANAPVGWTTINISTNAKEVVKIVNGAHDYNYTITNASRNITISDGAAHVCTAGTPTRENEVPATCTVSGSYDLVTKCTECGTVMKRETQTIDRLGHTKGTAVKENEVPATCATVGSYDSVIKCTVCGLTVSSEKVVVPFTDKHTPGEPRKENVILGDCKNPGSYDEVVDCSVCQKELSRTKVTGDKGTHVASSPKIEMTDSTCTTKGTLVEIYICRACGIEYDRKTTEFELLDHTPGDEVKENVVSGTCTSTGSYDSVYYCSVCKVKLSSDKVETPMLNHTPGKSVKENEVPATCFAGGYYDLVVSCADCKAEISREAKSVAKLEHVRGSAVIENRKEPVNCGANGSYDSVVYCTACNTELDRISQVIKAPDHKPGAAATESTPQICTVCNTILAPAVGHQHKWSSSWTNNGEGHWYACSGCSEKKNYEDHHFANSCDADCNICGYLRTTAGHSYDNDCDSDCNKCGEKRTVVGHVYDNDCDTTCNSCNDLRTTSHKYDNNCDADCNVCGTKRTPADHVYASWTTVKEPTATTDGQRERVCILCDTKQVEAIPATGEPETSAPEVTTEPTPPETSAEVTTEETPVTSEPVTSEPGTTESEVTTESTGTEETPSESDNETEPSDDEGCGSAISMGIALIAILGTAIILKKRD